MIGDTRKRRVLKSRKKSCFLSKLLEGGWLGREGFFQGNRDSEPLINGLIDAAHSAFSQLPDNAVAVLKNCARS